MFTHLYDKVSSKVLGKLTSPTTGPSRGSSKKVHHPRDYDEDSGEDEWINEEAKVIFDNLDMHFITRQIVAMVRSWRVVFVGVGSLNTLTTSDSSLRSSPRPRLASLATLHAVPNNSTSNLISTPPNNKHE